MTASLEVIDRGEGPAVVLVHGAGATAATTFAASLPALARGHRVLAVDLPGEEDGPADGWTLDAVADALAATVVSRVDGPVLLLGHSLGASVIARTALRHPQLAHRVVVVAAPWSTDSRLWLTTRLWRRLYTIDRTALAEHLVLSTTSPSWLATLHRDDAADLVRLAAELVPGSTGVHLQLAEQTDLAGDLAGLEAEVHVVLGEEDQLVPTAPWAAVEGSTVRQVHIWPGGHDVLAQNPHELVALVARLATIPDPSRRSA
ncbi:alpha/beta hydrolase [Aeromicrobium sp. YIM 150415]|uniref:alpha/beta fold hydrolase n=1 Tax=Aeromicrobium sp. YIM 150415 TaxID=2803912 RepID=UPI001962EF99|nr:alpha/beta hydrolase [Aeromicrobium sp. YIM 150415]MBM9464449.1 alpha/beta hydrolase [Aeromicrobium sp. YIM 150415]